LKVEYKIPRRLNKIRTVEKPIIFFLFFISSRLYFMGKLETKNLI